MFVISKGAYFERILIRINSPVIVNYSASQWILVRPNIGGNEGHTQKIYILSVQKSNRKIESSIGLTHWLSAGRVLIKSISNEALRNLSII